ncbi:hypothetical protein DFH07DRAFT_907349 [Mycena maculata]|uniref:BRCT domain-containing protein n=1 Tax=Mycena maculata TaxID=230809 RepID=A0AAD7HD54_9AGAR|nr:hypothetical protein DFH07DRAFT_907349 [Mycena maculata]
MLGGSCPRPFKNVVVCATGVLDKPALFKLALELGATSVSAFTDRVTHLVAEDHGGAKYLCALERKIPILTPSWIIESHRIWQHGDDVDLAQSVAAHRLPVFSGVTLCVSGITDIVRRTQINKAVTARGGTYAKALERPIRVTHLLCAGDEETDKMRYAEKFNRAKEANPPIQLVWEEWFWDCMEFGGRFDEARYQARLPRPERRAPPSPPSPDAANETLSAHLAHANAHLTHPSADDDDDEGDEVARVQRPPAVTLQLWGSLLKARGYEVDAARGGVVLSPGKAREMVVEKQKQGDADELGRMPQADGSGSGSGSVLGSFRRAASFVAPRMTAGAVPRVREASAGAGPSRLPFGRSSSGDAQTAAADPKPNAAGSSSARAKRLPAPESSFQAAASHAGGTNAAFAPQAGAAPPHSEPEPPSTVFAGRSFVLRGEADDVNVRGAIEGAGGRVVHGEEDGADFIIVRIVSGSILYLAEPSPASRARYRTECWLERCLFDDRLCAPDAHLSFVPLGIRLPVPGADRITLSFSGLDASEACWVRRLFKALGITLAPAFSRHTTHLLCPSGTGPKYARARQWGVPVVHMGWLAAMARDGAVPPLHDVFLVAVEEAADDTEVAAAEGQGRKDNGKGKEKADETMQDITNSYDSQDSQPKQEGFFLPAPPPARLSFGEPGPALRFGQPTGSLGRHSSDAGSHAPPATPSPLKRRKSGLSRQTTPLALVAVPIPTQSSVGSPSSRKTHPEAVRRTATFGGRTREEGGAAAERILSSSSPARVPSSNSPSPLRRGIPDQRTKALQESIVSLLGKRLATPEDEVSLGRPGKRGRPHRSKPQSRQPSDVLPVQTPAAELNVFGEGRSLSPGPDDNAEGLSIGADEQSLRVMYEDPGQHEERRRLASLIGEPLEGHGTSTRTTRPRRSTRRSGL